MSRDARAFLLRRIWLPRWLYEALPWLYLAGGAGALWGGLFGSDGAWYYPYAALAGLAAIHGGLWVSVARHRWRRRKVARLQSPGWEGEGSPAEPAVAAPLLAAGQAPPTHGL